MLDLNLMNKYLLFFFLILIIYSCNTKEENKASDKANSQDTLAPLQKTVIADLKVSLQPRTIALDTMPKPLTVVVPNKAGGSYTITNAEGEVSTINLEPPIHKPQAVLQNEKGEPILDSEGKPFMMGDGGKSNFTNFTTDDGLALDGISCSVMDKSGNLWFGTYGGGVSRYDGKSFTNFTTAQGLTNNSVKSITQDKTGNLWFGTDGGGVSRYDGKSFTNFTTAQGLVNNGVYSMTVDKTGNLWFGTLGGVSRYDGKSFTNFTTTQGLASNTVLSITEDKTGNLWFGTYLCGVSRYNGKSFTNFTTAQGLPNNNVICITEDKTGNLWFGTAEGLSCYDGKSFTNFTTAQGLASNDVFSMIEDKTGNLWFGTLGSGVSRYDGKSFTNFTTAQGLASNIVLNITEDKTGNLWFGTESSGLSRYNGKSFTNFTTAQGLANNTLRSIAEDKTGNLWFGSEGGGVSRYDGKSFTNFTTAQGFANINVNSIIEDKTGNLWFGTGYGGVIRYDGKSFTNLTTAQGLVNNSVWSITEDKTGNLWFATNGGVSCYDGKSFTNFTTAQGLANNTVLRITEDKTGNLWFGTVEGISFLPVQETKKLQENNDKVKGQGSTLSILFKSFKISDGLPDNYVTQVIQMPNGKIAIGTNLGITLFTISKDGNQLTDLEIYNTNTGYPVKDVNGGHNAMYLDSKGIIWAATGSEKTALIRFDYAALHKSKEPPALVIQSIKVKDENICWYNLQTKGVRKNAEDSASALLQEFLAYGKTLATSENNAILKRFGNIQFDSITPFYPLPQNLVLPYEHNQIAFEFAAIETDRPFLVRYQYMLEGYDEDWSPITNKSNANYGNIYEGTYTFKLKAQGANGVWCEPITYTFQVLPPLYRTWWAYLIYAVLFLLALRIFSNWRERHLRAEKERLEKTVEERTVEVVKEKNEANKQRQRSDELLLNILPQEVAEELKSKGEAESKLIDNVTVLFTDFKGFTAMSEQLTAKELVRDIHECFSAFDHIMEKYGMEKIKTIGDAYMASGGLPTVNETHATDAVNAAIEILQFIEDGKALKIAKDLPYFDIRIGVHTGPVVAGIVGVKKFAYDIWGDTVNTASRMESSGEAGKVNISGTTYELVKDQFIFTHRGKIQAKGKGELDMYYVEGRI